MRCGNCSASISAGSALQGRGRALGVGEVKFTDQVLPTVKRLIYGVDLKRVFSTKLVMGIADGWLEADGRRIYHATDLQSRPVQALRRHRRPELHTRTPTVFKAAWAA